jgi:hypothetical protein
MFFLLGLIWSKYVFGQTNCSLLSVSIFGLNLVEQLAHLVCK